LEDWSSSGEYGHGFLLLPIAVYLAWRTRERDPRPARGWGTAMIAGGVVLFLAGTLAAEFFTRRSAVLLVLAGLALHYRGWLQLRAWWLPFGLLAFTVPLPEVVLNSLTLPLQLLASRLAVALLEFRHVPAGLSGNIILLPGQELFVAEACSGLRSLSALLGLTLLIGGTALQTGWSRVALLLFAVPAALAANALRVFGTGFAAHYLGPGVTEGFLHEVAGALVFLLPLGLVGLITLLLRRAEKR
ncbi:MAG: exosortase/archaeosortase family protein, partial [Gemmatimonadota bacterium]